MAGKRQHFIPQFLQRGFASHFVGDEAFTWVYRKGSKPFNPNIKNVGVEGFFYSIDSDPSLDDAITVAEDGYAQLLNKLRDDNHVDKMDSEIIAQLFAHLEVRTRHLRQSYFTTGNYLLNELMEYLSDPASCENYFRKTIANKPSLIRDSLSEELRKRGLPQEALPIIMELSGPLIEQAMPSLVDNMANMVAHIKLVLPAKLKQASKAGHIKALHQTLAPELKVRRYENLSYKILSTNDETLLLGDSAIIFHVSGDRRFKPFLEKDDGLTAVILPISTRQVLVGSMEKYAINLSELRKEIAGCSLEYFITSKASADNENLSKNISENAHLLSNAQIEQLIDEITNG